MLPRDAAAINPTTGELRDRWGVPYVFHAISRDAVELRSSGPDCVAYPDDDVVIGGKGGAPLGAMFGMRPQVMIRPSKIAHKWAPTFSNPRIMRVDHLAWFGRLAHGSNPQAGRPCHADPARFNRRGNPPRTLEGRITRFWGIDLHSSFEISSIVLLCFRPRRMCIFGDQYRGPLRATRPNALPLRNVFRSGLRR